MVCLPSKEIDNMAEKILPIDTFSFNSFSNVLTKMQNSFYFIFFIYDVKQNLKTLVSNFLKNKPQI